MVHLKRRIRGRKNVGDCCVILKETIHSRICFARFTELNTHKDDHECLLIQLVEITAQISDRKGEVLLYFITFVH